MKALIDIIMPLSELPLTYLETHIKQVLGEKLLLSSLDIRFTKDISFKKYRNVDQKYRDLGHIRLHSWASSIYIWSCSIVNILFWNSKFYK